MRREKTNKIFLAISIILIIFIIVNFVLYKVTDRYTFINWEYVYTPEKADRYLIPIFIGLAILLLFSIVYIIIYYRQESKLTGNNIFRKFRHRQKTRNLKNELVAETKIEIPPQKENSLGLV